MRSKKVAGVTLLEIILVLAIGASLVVMGLRQYQLYRFDADAQQLQYNVDQLFQAMSGFYRANCDGYLSNGTPKGGKLFIFAIGNPNTSYAVELPTDLIGGGFLTALPAFSPLVDSTTPGTDYVLQFNNYSQPRYNGTGSASQMIGTILTWKIQVAVLLKNLELIDQYKSILNADCLSDINGSIVTPCSVGSGQGNYLVFERLPSFASPSVLSSFWPSTPALMQFKQMYSSSPITYSTSTGHMPEYQYFNCGS